MGGFGHGAFGSGAFGHWAWSREVLYSSMPELHRRADADRGGVLEGYTRGIRPAFDRALRSVRDVETLRDPLRAPTQYTNRQQILLGRVVEPELVVLRQAGSGSVSTAGIFTAPGGAFTEEDKGRELFVRNSSVPANHRKRFRIISVLSLTSVHTEPKIALDPTGVMRWEVRGVSEADAGFVDVEVRGGDPEEIRPGMILADGRGSQYEVVARQVFPQRPGTRAALSEREGDATQAFGAFTDASRAFVTSDVGKWLAVSGPGEALDGLYEITSVNGSAALSGTVLIPGFANNTNGGILYRYNFTTQYRVRVTHVVPGSPSQPLALSSRADGDSVTVTVSLATNSSGAQTTTASALVAAISADAGISLFLSALDNGVGTGLVGTCEDVAIPHGKSVGGGFRNPSFSAALDDAVQYAVRDRAVLRLRGETPRGVVEDEGSDADLPGGSSVLFSASRFSAGDVGKMLRLVGNEVVGDNGVFEILTVGAGGTSVTVAGTLAGSATLYRWEKRSRSYAGLRGVELLLQPQSMIGVLARDFGIEIDTQEDEGTQRSWVHNLAQWIDRKGAEDGYYRISRISGYDPQVAALYGVEEAPRLTYQIDRTRFVGELVMLGAGASLTSVLGVFRLTTAQSQFLPEHVGKVVHLTNSGSGNNGHYLVSGYVSGTVVTLASPAVLGTDPVWTALAAPDASNGALRWVLGQVYLLYAPEYPLMDEIDLDRAAQLSSGALGIDKSCEDEPYLFGVGGFGTVAVAGVVSNGIQHTVTGSGDFDVVRGLGVWKLTDSAGREYFLESVPSGAGPFTFSVLGETAPEVDPATLEYVCQPQLMCAHCTSYKVHLRLEEVLVPASAVARENAFSRLLARIDEVKPAHVEVVVEVVTVLSAALSLGAEFDHGSGGFPLAAPWSAYFDEFDGDELPLDKAVYAEFEVTTLPP